MSYFLVPFFPYHMVVFGFCDHRGNVVTVTWNASYWILLRLRHKNSDLKSVFTLQN